MENIAALLLALAVMPLWVAAGLADWYCHRRTAIEATSGWRESAFHLLLFAQMGLAGLGVLFLEVNALLVALVGLLWLAHEACTWLELRYVVPRREVRPVEQMIHSFLELLPLVALALLLLLAASDPLGLSSPEQWRLRPKEEPLPAGQALGVLGTIFVFNVVPLLEEAWRCWSARTALPDGEE